MAVSPLRQLTGFVKLLVRQYFMIALVFNFTSVFAISFVIKKKTPIIIKHWIFKWWRLWKFTMKLPGSSGVRHLVSGNRYVLPFQAFQVSRLKSTRSSLPYFVSASLSQIRLDIFYVLIMITIIILWFFAGNKITVVQWFQWFCYRCSLWDRFNSTHAQKLEFLFLRF